MTILKIIILIALGLVIVKFVALLFGRGNIPILNKLVTVILSIFVAFEFFKLGQILLEKLV
jgi:uncharacterized membrane protein required for colicin V production